MNAQAGMWVFTAKRKQLAIGIGIIQRFLYYS